MDSAVPAKVQRRGCPAARLLAMVVPPKTRYGDFCWVEHASPDPAETSRFYTSLLGWLDLSIEQVPVSGYRILAAGEEWLAGVLPMTEEQLGEDHSGRWISFVRVEDLSRTLQRAGKLGARLCGAKRAIDGFGRAAVLQDPQGVIFALWQPDPLPAADYVGSPGQPCWFEISCSDAEAAAAFFQSLFGWEVERSVSAEGEDFWILRNQGLVIGGLQEMEESFGAAPAQCLPFLSVRDCDATILAAKEAGAYVVLIPTELPGVGRHAVLEDSSGAAFGILEPG